MSEPQSKPVVVYGVSGYTGRLICEYLREYHVPFIAAGRDGKKVQAVVDKIPGIEITSLFTEIQADQVKKMLDVNVLGTALGIKHGLRAMRPDGVSSTTAPTAASGLSKSPRPDVSTASLTPMSVATRPG